LPLRFPDLQISKGRGFRRLRVWDTVAKVAIVIAIVVGGYQFAHGEPGAKETLAGVAAGMGIAVLAANVLTWLWGV
jgi:type IV secretion system protein VirB2